MMSGQRQILLRQVLLFFLAVLATAAAQEGAVASSFGRYHALVIGNQNYKYLSKLSTPRNDAREIAQILQDKYGFKVELLLDATREEILRALGRLRGTMTEDDNLLIYYAGHGFLDRATDVGYWQPIDAEEGIYVNGIPSTDLTTSFKGFLSKHILVIADSCFSGAILKMTRDSGTDIAYSSEVRLRRMRERKSRTALTSGGDKEEVPDAGGGNHSIFAKSLIDVLRNNRTILLGQDLFDQVNRLVVVNSRQTPRYDPIPMTGHDFGDFIFVPKGFTELPPAPPQPTASGRKRSGTILVDEGQPKRPPAIASVPPVREKNRTLTKEQQAQAFYYWQSDIQFSESSSDIKKFLEEYPEGKHVQAAQRRYQELRAKGK